MALCPFGVCLRFAVFPLKGGSAARRVRSLRCRRLRGPGGPGGAADGTEARAPSPAVGVLARSVLDFRSEVDRWALSCVLASVFPL